MLYSLVKPFLFSLDPEDSHDLTLKTLELLQNIPGAFPSPIYGSLPIKCFGLDFPARVGLAAGLDKNGKCIKAWQSMGFGFVEVGTVTPRPQPGNEKPRLFRLVKDRAIINRLGFNNEGVDPLVSRLKALKRSCPIGVNIGKNKDTPLEKAHEDYQICFEKAYSVADYVTVNISSPNTPGLRNLQQTEALRAIVEPLIEKRKELSQRHDKHVPIVVKISPDVSNEEILVIVDELIRLKVDGVIATNTTIERPTGLGQFSNETGGLSGSPLKSRATEVVKIIYERAKEALPIIAVGGISSAADAREKIEAGAKLVQIYTGFIYRGPQLIREIKNEVNNLKF